MFLEEGRDFGSQLSGWRILIAQRVSKDFARLSFHAETVAFGTFSQTELEVVRKVANEERNPIHLSMSQEAMPPS